MNAVRYYRRPPIVERVISIYADVSDEIFESRFDDWRSLVQKEFPVYEPLKQWLMNVQEKEGVPLFGTEQPEIRITPRFSRKRSEEGFDWSIRCPAGQLTMNMHSLPNQSGERRYANLRREFSVWLPKWIDHFSITSGKVLSFHYVNLINHLTVPDFVTPQGGIVLEKILTVFSRVPGIHEFIIPPYSCTATVKLRGHEGATLQIQVKDWSHPVNGIGVAVDFILSIDISNEPISPENILSLMDWGHERIVERFEVVFSEEVKATFEPVIE